MKLEKEGRYLEYKEAKKSLPKDFWETYSSFANTSGGCIILGVSDDLEVTGVQDVTKVQKDLVTTLNNPQRVSRNLLTDDNISVEKIDGKHIIKIYVPEANPSQKPIYMNQNPKQAWVRDFETDRKVTDEELKAMLRNAQEDLDSDLLDGFDIHDLDKNTLGEYKILLSRNNQRYGEMSDEQMLIEVGALKRDRQNKKRVSYKLTIGGLLFFGKYTSITSAPGLQHFHLDYFNRLNAVTRWRDRVAPGEPDYDNINVFSFYRIVLAKLLATIESGFELTDELVRTNYISDMEVALREALANTLIHADYFSEDSVKVEVYNSYYQFFNPGKMKISVEEFINGGTPKPRNHTITNLFRKIGISERAGSGGPQIIASARENKLNFPEIIVEQQTTLLKIWKVDVADAHPELSDSEKLILKFLTKEALPQNSKAIRDNLDLSKYYFDKSIKNLLDNQFIDQIGKGRATKYALKIGTAEYITSLQRMVDMIQSYRLGQ